MADIVAVTVVVNGVVLLFQMQALFKHRRATHVQLRQLEARTEAVVNVLHELDALQQHLVEMAGKVTTYKTVSSVLKEANRG